MKYFKIAAIQLALLAFAVSPARAEGIKNPPGPPKPLYENNFEALPAGPLPETPEFMVVDGAFAVKEEGGNKFLELPGAPLDTFTLLFGPTEKADVAVSARIRGTGHGRRYPTFAVGVNGQGGYRLQVSPAKKTLEILKGDESLASVPYEWKSGEWTWLRLQITETGATWKLEGKAWQSEAKEPEKPLITCEETKEPSAGRASVWGSPFANTPIQYDDLKVQRVVTK